MAAAIIVIAAGVAFGRVLLEILVVAPGIFASTAPPLVMMMVMIGALGVTAYVTSRGAYTEPLSREAPADLRAALAFGLLYAVVVFLVAAAKEHFGASGMYVVAGLSGLTDMDALTLSTAQLTKDGRIDPERAWRLILVASMANLAFKGAAVAVVGHPRLLARVGIFFGIALAGGVGILAFWIG